MDCVVFFLDSLVEKDCAVAILATNLATNCISLLLVELLTGETEISFTFITISVLTSYTQTTPVNSSDSMNTI